MNLIETVSNDSYNFTNLGLDTCSCRDDDDVQSFKELFISICLQFHHILVSFCDHLDQAQEDTKSFLFLFFGKYSFNWHFEVGNLKWSPYIMPLSCLLFYKNTCN